MNALLRAGPHQKKRGPCSLLVAGEEVRSGRAKAGRPEKRCCACRREFDGHRRVGKRPGPRTGKHGSSCAPGCFPALHRDADTGDAHGAKSGLVTRTIRAPDPKSEPVSTSVAPSSLGDYPSMLSSE